MFHAKSDDFWYPTIEEMKKANVIHKVIEFSELALTQQENVSRKKLEKALGRISIFQSVKLREPTTYKLLLDRIEGLINQKNGRLDFLTATRLEAQKLAAQLMPRTSDEAVRAASRALIFSLKAHVDWDPIQCMKVLYPEEFGEVTNSQILSDEQLDATINAMKLIIDSGLGKPARAFNKFDAEKTLQEAREQLATKALYLDAQNLTGEEDYRDHCNAVIAMYEYLVAQEPHVLGNSIRYLISP